MQQVHIRVDYLVSNLCCFYEYKRGKTKEAKVKELIANLSHFNHKIENQNKSFSHFIECIVYVGSGSWISHLTKFVTLSMQGNVAQTKVYDLHFAGPYTSAIELDEKTKDLYVTSNEANIDYAVFIKEIF